MKKLSERRNVDSKKLAIQKPQLEVLEMDDIVAAEEGESVNLVNEPIKVTFVKNPGATTSYSNYSKLSLPSKMSTPLTPAGHSPNYIKMNKTVRRRHNSNSVSEMCSSSGFLTVRQLSGDHKSSERYADEIVDAFQQDENLMDDSPESEQLRLETLRELTEGLGIKRNVKNRLSRTVSLNSQYRIPRGPSRVFRYRVQSALSKMRSGARNTVSGFEFWYREIKDIEGKFGSGVATYFNFLRTMILLNSCILIICLGFLIIPQLLDRYYIVTYKNETVLQVEPNTNPYSNNTPFEFSNIFTGEGWLENTELFFGSYSNDSVQLTEKHEYHIPSAYLFTTFISFILSLIILAIKLAKSYRKNFIEMQGGLKNIFAQKIFCGWDFSIIDNEAAYLRSQSITNELREMLHEVAVHEQLPTNKLRKCVLYATRISVTILVLSLLIGSGALVWVLLDVFINDAEKLLLMPTVITCVILFLPMIFSKLTILERYANPRKAVYVTLLRIFILEVAIVSVLLAFWLQRAKQNEGKCWETSMGQEVYRLIIVDFILSLILLSIVEFFRALLHRTVWPGIGAAQFDIARNTLNLIYNQTLFWVGLYFSPLLAVVIVIKLVITFYLKKLCVLYNCKPSPRCWRAAQTQTIFLGLTFLAIVGITLTMGYVTTQVPTSDVCGPFKDYNYVYEMLKHIFNEAVYNGFLSVFKFFTTPGVVAFIIVFLCVLVYYIRAIANARTSMVKLLRNMLLLEAEDKIYLQRSISDAIKSGLLPPPSSPLNLRSSRAQRSTGKKTTL